MESDATQSLARTVRQFRTARDWTIDQLVARSGVSKGAVVAVENGTTNPSLTTIERLADALAVSITDLLQPDAESRIQIIDPTDFRLLWNGPLGGEASIITTVSSPSPVEFWRWRLIAGERYEGHPHPVGFRETLVVITGELELLVGGELSRICAGSVAVFDASVDHAYIAPTVDTEFLMAVHLLPLVSSVGAQS